MPNKEMTLFHTTSNLVLRLITICNLIIIYIYVLLVRIFACFILLNCSEFALLSKSLKMKPDGHVCTCKAYMDP